MKNNPHLFSQEGQSGRSICLLVITDSAKVIPNHVERVSREFPSQIVIPSLECTPPLPLRDFSGLVLFLDCFSGDCRARIRKLIGGQILPPSVAVIDPDENHDAAELIRMGIGQVISLPLAEDELIRRIHDSLKIESTVGPERLKRKLFLKFGTDQFVGESPLFLQAIDKMMLYSRLDASVLIAGETGTGKESIARAIHYLSNRTEKPFIPINCGAIPDDLFENELFGHVRGAYTDASQTHRGLVLEANGGTPFLDEINTLSSSAQVKLLRFLDDKRYTPLGSAKHVEADIRFIFATNVGLWDEVQSHRLREDLYYRINLLSIDLPPLRTRGADVSVISLHYLEHYARVYRKSLMSFSDDAMSTLNGYEWPGNVRELKNIVEKAVIMSRSSVITSQDLEVRSMGRDKIFHPGSLREAKHAVVEIFEKEYLLSVLKENNWNVTKAANSARKDRRSFQRLLRKYGIQPAASG